MTTIPSKYPRIAGIQMEQNRKKASNTAHFKSPWCCKGFCMNKLQLLQEYRWCQDLCHPLVIYMKSMGRDWKVGCKEAWKIFLVPTVSYFEASGKSAEPLKLCGGLSKLLKRHSPESLQDTAWTHSTAPPSRTLLVSTIPCTGICKVFTKRTPHSLHQRNPFAAELRLLQLHSTTLKGLYWGSSPFVQKTSSCVLTWG